MQEEFAATQAEMQRQYLENSEKLAAEQQKYQAKDTRQQLLSGGEATTAVMTATVPRLSLAAGCSAPASLRANGGPTVTSFGVPLTGAYPAATVVRYSPSASCTALPGVPLPVAAAVAVGPLPRPLP